jgi:hypothetical protein
LLESFSSVTEHGLSPALLAQGASVVHHGSCLLRRVTKALSNQLRFTAKTSFFTKPSRLIISLSEALAAAVLLKNVLLLLCCFAMHA